MWRHRDVLPSVDPVTLGEGWTPTLRGRRYENVFLEGKREQSFDAPAQGIVSLEIVGGAESFWACQ